MMAEHLRAELALAALERALVSREIIPGGLVHHSDRGVQYACGDYLALLEQRGIQPSMSRPGCPYDNAPARAPARAPCRDGSTALPSMAESFVKTLKQEEVDGRTYRTLADAQASIGGFIETVYNRQRLHSALGYPAPMEFEATTPAASAAVQQSRLPATTDCP